MENTMHPNVSKMSVFVSPGRCWETRGSPRQEEEAVLGPRPQLRPGASGLTWGQATWHGHRQSFGTSEP